MNARIILVILVLVVAQLACGDRWCDRSDDIAIESAAVQRAAAIECGGLK